MTDIERGYVAGILDGEGNIRINPGGVSIRIVQKDERLIRYLEKLLPTWKAFFSNTDKMHIIQICRTSEVLSFLTEIRSLLIVKGEDVDEVISFCINRLRQEAIREKLHITRGRGRPLG